VPSWRSWLWTALEYLCEHPGSSATAALSLGKGHKPSAAQLAGWKLAEREWMFVIHGRGKARRYEPTARCRRAVAEWRQAQGHKPPDSPAGAGQDDGTSEGLPLWVLRIFTGAVVYAQDFDAVLTCPGYGFVLFWLLTSRQRRAIERMSAKTCWAVLSCYDVGLPSARNLMKALGQVLEAGKPGTFADLKAHALVTVGRLYRSGLLPDDMVWGAAEQIEREKAAGVVRSPRGEAILAAVAAREHVAWKAAGRVPDLREPPFRGPSPWRPHAPPGGSR